MGGFHGRGDKWQGVFNERWQLVTCLGNGMYLDLCSYAKSRSISTIFLLHLLVCTLFHLYIYIYISTRTNNAPNKIQSTPPNTTCKTYRLKIHGWFRWFVLKWSLFRVPVNFKGVYTCTVVIRPKRMCCPCPCGNIRREARNRGRRVDFGHWGSWSFVMLWSWVLDLPRP